MGTASTTHPRESEAREAQAGADRAGAAAGVRDARGTEVDAGAAAIRLARFEAHRLRERDGRRCVGHDGED